LSIEIVVGGVDMGGQNSGAAILKHLRSMMKSRESLWLFQDLGRFPLYKHIGVPFPNVTTESLVFVPEIYEDMPRTATNDSLSLKKR
jgi:hypothetical protein